MTDEELLKTAKDALASPAPPPTDEVSPIFRPRFWSSRKFVGSVVMTGVAFAVAAVTGGLSAATVPLCLAPFLAWLGVEGAIDFRAAKK